MIDINYILIYATTRSGHHAFMNWLSCQLPYHIIHYNSPNVNSFIDGFFKADGRKLMVKEYNRDREKKNILVNFEDFNFDLYKDVNFSSLLDKQNQLNILFLRDAYNTIASNIVGLKDKSDRQFLYPRIEAWIQHAKKFTEDINCNMIKIKYNQWFTEKSYRKWICEDIFGCDFTDRGIDIIPDMGAGSSFDKKHYQGRANKMNVLYRYKQLEDNIKFQSVLKDYPEIHELNDRIFNFKL